MPINKGSSPIKNVYIGSSKIKEIYKGSTLVFQGLYPSGTVLFESGAPGTYNLRLEHTQEYSIVIVGGGAGGSGAQTGSTSLGKEYRFGGGGSGALINGTVTLSPGLYSIVVGAGGASGYKGVGTSGKQSSFLNNVAGGGVAHITSPSGGAATVVTSGLNGTNGNSGTTKRVYGSPSGEAAGGASLYGGYGAGGVGSYTSSQAGTDGYVKIWVP